jgi:G3E family GTPase
MLTHSLPRLNIDAALIRNHKVSQTQEKLVQLQNGCICCTLRGDLLSELARLTKLNEIQYVIIESTGISEPMQVAETFTAEFSSAMLEAEDQIGENDEDTKKIVNEM